MAGIAEETENNEEGYCEHIFMPRSLVAQHTAGNNEERYCEHILVPCSLVAQHTAGNNEGRFCEHILVPRSLVAGRPHAMSTRCTPARHQDASWLASLISGQQCHAALSMEASEAAGC